MTKRPSYPSRTTAVDLEEIRPHIFMVREPRARALLKGEGKIDGQRFELTSWRRDGLLARLRENGFVVYTLEDRVKALPGLSPAHPIGASVIRLAGNIERYSHFDPLALVWAPDEPVVESGQKQVSLRVGWIVRRRKGRGAASYHRVFAERGDTAGLVPLDETTALLEGYAQARLLHRTPLSVLHHSHSYLLPDIELPPPHRNILARLGKLGETGWQVATRGWPLACAVYERLGLALEIRD